MNGNRIFVGDIKKCNYSEVGKSYSQKQRK